MKHREANASERRCSLLTVPKKKGVACYTATWGSTRVDQEAEKSRGKHRPQPSLCFPWERKAKQRNSLGVAGLKDSSRPWGQGDVPSDLAPGPGVT